MAGQTIKARNFKCADEEWKLIKSSAKMRNLSVQDYVMKAVREELENSSTQADEPDLITQIARTSFFCAATLSNGLPSELREKYIQSAKAKYPYAKAKT